MTYKKIAIVTDSVGGIPEELANKENVFVLPIDIIFSDKTFKEGKEINDQEFYERLKKEHPKTSQPAIGEITMLYEQLKQDGYDAAIVIHCSSGISGTFNNSVAAAEMAEFDIYPIDSRIGIYPMYKMVEYAYEAVQKQTPVNSILEHIEHMIQQAQILVIPASLEQLHKSGRVSGMQMMLGTLLSVKLLLTFENGKVVPKDKTRTDKKAWKKAFDSLFEDIQQHNVQEVAIVHCNHLEGAEQLEQDILKSYPDVNVLITPLSLAIGVHAGDKTLGFSWLRN